MCERVFTSQREEAAAKLRQQRALAREGSAYFEVKHRGTFGPALRQAVEKQKQHAGSIRDDVEEETPEFAVSPMPTMRSSSNNPSSQTQSASVMPRQLSSIWPDAVDVAGDDSNAGLQSLTAMEALRSAVAPRAARAAATASLVDAQLGSTPSAPLLGPAIATGRGHAPVLEDYGAQLAAEEAALAEAEAAAASRRYRHHQTASSASARPPRRAEFETRAFTATNRFDEDADNASLWALRRNRSAGKSDHHAGVATATETGGGLRGRRPALDTTVDLGAGDAYAHLPEEGNLMRLRDLTLRGQGGRASASAASLARGAMPMD
jgi:hypothetical protein